MIRPREIARHQRGMITDTRSTCAIIGGVLTIAGLVDSFIFNGAKRLKGEGDNGFAGPGGKMVRRLTDLVWVEHG